MADLITGGPGALGSVSIGIVMKDQTQRLRLCAEDNGKIRNQTQRSFLRTAWEVRERSHAASMRVFSCRSDRAWECWSKRIS